MKKILMKTETGKLVEVEQRDVYDKICYENWKVNDEKIKQFDATTSINISAIGLFYKNKQEAKQDAIKIFNELLDFIVEKYSKKVSVYLEADLNPVEII